MSKWPKKITLQSREWKIRYLKPENKAFFNSNGEHEALLGFCDESKGLIVIDSTQNDETKKDTLVHELFHAVYARLPGVDHDDEDAEENFVLAATLCFFEIVRNTGRWYLPEGEEDGE